MGFMKNIYLTRVGDHDIVEAIGWRYHYCSIFCTSMNLQQHEVVGFSLTQYWKQPDNKKQNIG